jgi:hypothetical protein
MGRKRRSIVTEDYKQKVAAKGVFSDEEVAEAFKSSFSSETELHEAVRLLEKHRPELAKKILPWGI